MSFYRKSRYAIAFAALISATINLEGADPHRGSVTVPVMTPLTVKMNEAMTSKTTANGSGFTATIKDPVQVGGMIAIPANSSAAGLVRKEANGGGEMELNSVFVGGRLYRITTSPISFNQKSNLRAGSTFTFQLVLSLNIAR